MHQAPQQQFPTARVMAKRAAHGGSALGRDQARYKFHRTNPGDGVTNPDFILPATKATASSGNQGNGTVSVVAPPSLPTSAQPTAVPQVETGDMPQSAPGAYRQSDGADNQWASNQTSQTPEAKNARAPSGVDRLGGKAKTQPDSAY